MPELTQEDLAGAFCRLFSVDGRQVLARVDLHEDRDNATCLFISIWSPYLGTLATIFNGPSFESMSAACIIGRLDQEIVETAARNLFALEAGLLTDEEKAQVVDPLAPLRAVLSEIEGESPKPDARITFVLEHDHSFSSFVTEIPYAQFRAALAALPAVPSGERLTPAADVLERVAREQSSDPAADDLTVPLAIELADAQAEVGRLRDALKDAHAALDEAGRVLRTGGHPSEANRILVPAALRARASLSPTDQSKTGGGE